MTIDNNNIGDNSSSNDGDLVFKVTSPDVVYTDTHILSNYVYRDTKVIRSSNNSSGVFNVIPTETKYQFKVDRRVPKLG